MGNRAKQRLKHFASVRVFGTDSEGRQFARLAHTVDVSESGVRIAGIYVPLKKGQVVGVQQGPEKASFKVVWTGKLGSHNAGELGLQLLHGEKQIWNLAFPFVTKDDYSAAEVSIAERRRDERVDCELGVELRTSPDAPPTLVHCTDISRGGCYLETWSPLPIGTQLYLVFMVGEFRLQASAEVRTMDSSFGMGIQFLEISPAAALDDLLARLKTRIRTEKETALKSGEEENTLPVSPNLDQMHQLNNRVLLADDSKFLRNAYAMYLRRNEFETLLATDGDEAYRLAVQHIPDVIVLDLLMPRIGGVSCLKILKDNPLTSHVPVIVLSGLPSSNGAKLLEAGAFAYLSKSEIGPEELPELVRKALRSKNSVSQSQQKPVLRSLPATLGGEEHFRF